MKRAIFCIALCVLFTLLQCCNVSSSDDAVAILAKSFEHSGCNAGLFHSGAAEFNVVSILSSPNEAARKQGIEENVLRQNVKIVISGNYLAIPGVDMQKSKRLLDIKEENKQTTRTITMGTPEQPNSYMAFDWDPNQNLLNRFQGEQNSRWMPEFQEFGRVWLSPGLVPVLFLSLIEQQGFTLSDNVVKDFKNLKEKMAVSFSCSIAGETTYDGSAKAKIIEVKQDDRLIETYHIDIDRGYLCPYACQKDLSGRILSEYKSSDYFVEKNTGLYYPQHYIETSGIFLDIEYVTVMEFHLVPDTLRFNIPVSDKEFAIDIPAKAFVFDVPPLKPLFEPGRHYTQEEMEETVKKNGIQTREAVGYRSSSQGTISFADNGYELEKLPWLVKEVYGEKKAKSDEEIYPLPSVSITRVVLIISGSALILIGVILLLIGKIRSRNR